ncbi:MAG: Lrp/AsnC family transcriptional regulator [Chloroflexi bacterium]|nr:Lrp/AsnC family transcriptional regulator [Chloroflexota bacterium]
MPGKTGQNWQATSEWQSRLLDPVNTRLLQILLEDPRLPVAAVARRVNMSAPAVTERLQRLREAGVIAGCRLELDPKALGLPIAAYVRVRPAPGQLERIANLARATPQVVECHRITGEDCFLLKVHAAAIDQLEAILDCFLAFGQTTTSIVQSSPVPARALPLPVPA